MFNIFGSNNTAKDIIDSMPKFAWKVGPSFYIDEKEYTIGELVDYVKNLIKENKDLNDILKSIEEDGTEEHNNAIKLREENAQLKIDIDNWKNGVITWRTQYDQEVARNTKLEDEIKELKNWSKILTERESEMYKEVLGLRHLKEENVRLMERVNKIDSDQNEEYRAEIFALKNDYAVLRKKYIELQEKYNGMVNDGGLKYMEAKLQIVQNNYTMCSKERDEYKHQLNAANKEIEILKNWKKEQLTVQSWWDKVDSYVRDHDDAPLGGVVANTCLNFLKERDELKKLSEELQITTKHAVEDRDRWHNLFEEGIKQQREVEEDNKKRIDGLSLTIDRKNFEIDDLKAEIKKLKEDIVDYVIEKDDKLDEAKETIDVLKNMKAQGFEDYDPRDFEKDDELKKTQDWNRLVHGVETEKVYVCNHCGYKIGHNTNQWGGCACCKDGLMIEKEEAIQKHPMYPFHWSGLDNTLDFRNNIKIETSTIGKLEEEKEWVCPCNKCKERRESKSVPTWEEAASDLALRVAKLEEQIKYTQKIKFKE